MPSQAWADMDQDVEDESECLITEKDGTLVATTYFREADGRQIKREKRYRVHKKVYRVSSAVRQREAAWKKFGYEALNFNKMENKRFMTSSTSQEEQLRAPKNFGLLAGSQPNEMGQSTGLETTMQRRLLADIKKLFDLLANPDPAALLAMTERDETSIPIAMTAPERQGRTDNDDRTIRVSNLPEYTTDEELGLLFGRVGQVVRTYLARHKETNVSKGFAFITFKNRSDAETAVNELHKKGFQNVLLNIEWAKKKANP